MDKLNDTCAEIIQKRGIFSTRGDVVEGVICSSCLKTVDCAIEYFLEEGLDHLCEDCLQAMLSKLQDKRGIAL